MPAQYELPCGCKIESGRESFLSQCPPHASFWEAMHEKARLDHEKENTPQVCGCCGEDMLPGQRFCCTDDFPEPGDIRETGR